MKIYCGTYAKYNEGSLFGEWIDLDDYSSKEDFIDYCRELHKDEEDPELMFQDYEYEYEWEKAFISESYLNEDYFTFRNRIKDENINQNALSTFINLRCCRNEDTDLSIIDDFIESYQGEFSSAADYCEQFLEETGGLEQIPQNLRYYFDFESYARDCMLNSEFDFDNGYIFV